MSKNEEVYLALVCVEDWQGAYINGILVDQGHEVNVIGLVNKYRYFSDASWEYLNFPQEEDFDEFVAKFAGEMPEKLEDLKEWRL
jgi:hypothetical protein